MSCVLDNLYTNSTRSQAFTYFRALRQCTLFSHCPFLLGWLWKLKTQLFPWSIWHKSHPTQRRRGTFCGLPEHSLTAASLIPWLCKKFFKEGIPLNIQASPAWYHFSDINETEWNRTASFFKKIFIYKTVNSIGKEFYDCKYKTQIYKCEIAYL